MNGNEPTTASRHADIIDLITESAQVIEEVHNEDGTISKILTIDPEIIFWKTQIVNSPTFARFVFELKNFEKLADQATRHMSKERGIVLGKQIKDIVKAFKYSVSAKSSESLRDKYNTSQTLIDKLNRNKIEKSFTIKDKLGKGGLSSLIGKDDNSQDD